MQLLLVCLPLAWVACVPLPRWMEFVYGRSPPWHFRAILAGIIGVYPLLWLLGTASLAWRRPMRGWTYRVDDLAIRWGDANLFWKYVRAARIDRDAAGRPRKVRLLSASRRTHDFGLSDDPGLADAAAAFIAARVPAYDAATHGPLGLPSSVPRVATAVLVAACALVAAAVGRIGYERARHVPQTIAATVVLVPIAWYVGVRPFLGRLQRQRAVAYAMAAIMTTSLAAFVAAAVPVMRRVAADLKATPAEERERVSRTITNSERRGK